jgi:hypothetical protein
VRSIYLCIAAILALAACTNDNPADAPAPPPPTSAVHDTIAMHSPPLATGRLGHEYTCRLIPFGISSSISINDNGVKYHPAGVWQPYEIRVGDSARVWFRGENIPFSPHRMTYNGHIVGDSIVGWAMSEHTLTGVYRMRELVLRRVD